MVLFEMLEFCYFSMEFDYYFSIKFVMIIWLLYGMKFGYLSMKC